MSMKGLGFLRKKGNPFCSMTRPEPSYLRLVRSGQIQERVKALYLLMSPCRLCPRACMAKRLEGKTGVCGIATELKVAAIHPHFGEEEVLVGRGGSGTVFLAGCNLKCVFCQNFEISQFRQGETMGPEALAEGLLSLQRMGCANINLVTPTHVVPMLIEAIALASQGGLHLPIVYNCGGYENPQTLKLLDGLVDIYMPDIKYGSNEAGERLSGVPDYFSRVKGAVLEMHRQVGDLKMGEDGLAFRGLLVRHLILPNDTAKTENVLRFLAFNVSKDTYLNLMSQYRPLFQALSYLEIARRPLKEELMHAVTLARSFGLHRGF